MNLEDLKKPFVSKWRVQSFSKNKPLAICIPYIDARDVMNRLDEVCGAENWQCDYKQIKEVMYCGISIFIMDRWVWKWDCGVESNVEKAKGEASDAFKRAFVKWGGARDLYESDMQYVQANEKKTKDNYPYCVDDTFNKIFDLTGYINERLGKMSKLPDWYNEAVKFLSNGGLISAIEKKYKLTPELREQLLNDAV